MDIKKEVKEIAEQAAALAAKLDDLIGQLNANGSNYELSAKYADKAHSAVQTAEQHINMVSSFIPQPSEK